MLTPPLPSACFSSLGFPPSFLSLPPIPPSYPSLGRIYLSIYVSRSSLIFGFVTDKKASSVANELSSPESKPCIQCTPLSNKDFHTTRRSCFLRVQIDY